MRFRRRILALAVLALCAPASPAAAQESGGPLWQVNAAEIRFGGRVQTQLNTTSAESQPPTQILLRRVQLEARVKLNDLVSGRVQTDFSGETIGLRDAWMRIDFAPELQLLAGKAHRPFSLIEQISSNRTLPIERGGRIRGVGALEQYALVNGLRYSDRDIGLQLLGAAAGAPLSPTYQVGVFAGPLHGLTGTRDSYQTAARVSVQPLTRLRLGAAWSARDFQAEDGLGGWAYRRGQAFSLDAQYGDFRPGFHLIGEVSIGDLDPFADDRFTGAQGWLAYRTQPIGKLSAIEPIFRASHGRISRGDPGVPNHGGLLLTPGVNLHLGGLNRLMLNYDAWRPTETGSPEGGLKLQFQMAF
jgi:hypothetical protein